MHTERAIVAGKKASDQYFEFVCHWLTALLLFTLPICAMDRRVVLLGVGVGVAAAAAVGGVFLLLANEDSHKRKRIAHQAARPTR